MQFQIYKIVKYLTYLIAITLASGHYSYGQHLNLNFTCSKRQAKYSIVSIDRRSNTQLLGYLPVKGYTGLAEVQFNGALVDSIGNFFLNPSPGDSRSGVLILENFFLNGGASPAKLMLSMRFYSETADGKYTPICVIDTIYRLGAGDPSAQISELFCEISKQVHAKGMKPAHHLPPVSRNDLNHLDSLENCIYPCMSQTSRLPVSTRIMHTSK